MATRLIPSSRKRNFEKTYEGSLDYEEDGEEYDVVADQDSRIRRPAKKQGRRVSAVFREISTLAKIGKNAKALECVFSRFPKDVLEKAACISPIWCTVAYKVLRRTWGGSNPFVRVWMAEPEEHVYMKFNGELHYHSELMTETAANITERKPFIPQINTVITFATSVMEDIFYDDEEELKFPHPETVIYGLTERVVANKAKYWDPFEDLETGYGCFERRCMVTSLFIPKSDHFDIVPFSTPLKTDESGMCSKDQFMEIVMKNYQLESNDELPSERSLKAIIFFQFCPDPFLKSFVDCANQQGINFLGGIFSSFGFNTNDEHSTLAVGLSFWAKTDDSACLNISSYGVCMSEVGSEQKIMQIKEECDKYLNVFVIMYACGTEEPENEEMVLVTVTEEEYLEEERYWIPQKGGTGARNKYIREGMKIFKSLMPQVPMIGAILHNAIMLGDAALGDKRINGPTDLGFLVVTYN